MSSPTGDTHTTDDTPVSRGRLVVEESSLADRLALGLFGVGLATIVLSWLALFQWVSNDVGLAGVPLFELLGGGLVVAGLGVAGLGVASRQEIVETTPDETAGLLTGVLFGVIGLFVGGLVAAHTFGLGLVGWLPAALVVGLGTAALAVVPREDLGSTLPAGAFLVLAGGVVVAGVVDGSWTWTPEDLSLTLIGPVVVPLLLANAALVGVWSAAKAQGGFGIRGRQRGAFMLVSLTVLGMLAVLALLIAFIVAKGLATVLTGVEFGPGSLTVAGLELPWLHLDVPFVMNVTQSIYVDVNGVMPAIVGTVWLVAGAVLFAVPLGVGAAVFLTEYTEDDRLIQVVEVATNGLWSTPSIVFGLFGLTFLLPRVSGGRKSLLGGMLVLGFMLLPLVLITSREAIKAVPDEYRDASAALGVTRWQTVRSVVLPAAMPGVITGVILGVGRIAGETAPLLLVFGGSPFPNAAPKVLAGFRLSLSPPFVTNEALMQAGSALPYQLYTSITSGHVPGDTFTVAEFGWGTAFVLLVVVLAMYAVGIGTRLYFKEKLNHE